MTFIDKRKIKTIAEKRTIKSLVHFTRIDNLPTIFDKGLCPQPEAEKVGAIINDNTNKNPDSICLSITHSSGMFKAMQEKDYSVSWCVIALAPDILWEHECRFYPANAVRRNFRGKPPSDFQGDSALEAMFKNTIAGEKNLIDTRNKNLLSYMPTNQQAEVRVVGAINPQHFRGIYIKDAEDEDKIRSMINPPNQIEINQGSFLFNTRDYCMQYKGKREDYIKWLNGRYF